MTVPIKTITASEAVVQSLKKRIRDCEFGPGQKLPSEQALLKEYDVSRLTLREALAKLVAWGIIQVRHGKGAYVCDAISIPALSNVFIPLFPKINIERVEDLVEARNVIESEVTAKVAEIRTKGDIRELDDLLKFNTREIVNADTFADRDYAFHLALVRMAGNYFFSSIYQALHLHIRSFLIEYANSVTNWEEALDRHTPILKAIIDKDREKAKILAREHTRICASYIQRYKEDSSI